MTLENATLYTNTNALDEDIMIQPYHFTKEVGTNFIDFFKKVINCNGILCFDFEDSVNVLNQSDLADLKKNHRRKLLGKLQNIALEIDFSRIGFRINSLDSAYYLDDIKEIEALGSVNCIFIPKIEHRIQIEKLIDILPDNIKEFIPIIETKTGFDNIEEILSVKNEKFIKIAFGHCDFNLSHRYFPFFHQDSILFWNWIMGLESSLKMAGKQLINSPVLVLENERYFSWVIKKNRSYKTIIPYLVII